MALVRKPDPVGIDKIIDSLQRRIFSSLSVANKWNLQPARWNCYPACYRNQTKDGGYVAEVFTGGKDYTEAWYNDQVDVTSFFGVATEQMVNADNMMVANIHLVFFVDLNKIKPGADRKDELVKTEAQAVIDSWGTSLGFVLTKVSVGIEACLREYPGSRKAEGLKFRDMHPGFVFRFDMQVFYQPTQVKC